MTWRTDMAKSHVGVIKSTYENLVRMYDDYVKDLVSIRTLIWTFFSLCKFIVFMIMVTGARPLYLFICRMIWPLSANEWIKEGRVCLKKDKYKDAEKKFIACVEHYPKHQEGYAMLCETQLRLRKYNECINTAKLGLSIDPSWKMLKERIIEADGVMKGKLTESQLGAGFFQRDGRALS
mmetsp:Transcript_23441/g.36112  ORF Transcript_23441/g.36112 Transcript_23441/m.36112 type:complete len:179 (-) Transcript_23441:216-752(-)|eukprot:CAMPEP_0196812896 /NCGR_PEP_ID=MMETSP1362-20130617/32103_1 /TAXON_ID=163516 /ORGANISM="Leptocylindrus danicus, Strain CCMP1856" /LENGTH=178 /DNA_ID=CAMNT_0042188841 /DNA_START=40 /DNA_END=576 /DNA_ORIENTATION=-